jgi:hypothetical protein
VSYDLYDLESANLVAHAATREELLAYVRRVIEADGEQCAVTLALGRADHTGGSISGEDLIRLALSGAHA